MNIFNSLGSNYSFNFVLKALITLGEKSVSQKLISYLEKMFSGQVMLTYKGREALELGLKVLNLPADSYVGICGFTCYAVYKAVKNANLEIEYLDIPEDDINFTPDTLKKALNSNPKIKAIVVQNTLGYPSQIEEIAKICIQNEVILIEDLAHSVGAKYLNNIQAGLAGDLTVLSFSQDKIVDAISGGALIIRNTKYQTSGPENLTQLNLKQQIIDRFYPLFTYKIRNTYSFFGLGKIIHFALKKLNLLSQPMAGGESMHKLPYWYSKLIFLKFSQLNKNIEHRRKIAQIYAQTLDPKVIFSKIVEQISYSANLRFPIFSQNRPSLIKHLKKSGVYVSDIWYDAPIAPKKYMHLTDFSIHCPNSQKISSQILNLPTHQNVSLGDAKKIAEQINLWLKSL